MTAISPRHSPLNWGLLVFLGVIWGASFPSVSVALGGGSPLWIATLRITMAALVLTAIAVLAGPGLPGLGDATGRRVWLHCLGMAVFSNAVPFSLLSWGQQYVTSGFAGITMAVVPLFVLPLAHVFVPGELLTPRRVLGFGIGFAGVAVLIGPAVFTATGAQNETLARIACLGAPLCYAIGAIITRRTPPTAHLSFSAAAVLAAALMLLPVTLVREGLPTIPASAPLVAILYLGLVPTALATVILVRIIAQEGPGFLSLVNYQVPVWSALMGFAFLSEALPLRFVVALGLILGGVAISQARGSQRFRP